MEMLLAVILLHVSLHAVSSTVDNRPKRVYYIAAVELDWDYAPQGNVAAMSLQRKADVFLKSTSDRIGSTYKKAVYRQYTDMTFSKQMPHPPSLGLLGPVVKGEVGEDIVVYFKNLASRPYSMHPHGVAYEKNSEGAMYLDGTSGSNKIDEDVQPGKLYKYVWIVKKAPAEHDPGCLSWTYHSHRRAVEDTTAGLIGLVLTCKKGVLRDDNTRSDVDYDIPLLFKVFDENISWYIQDNINKFTNTTVDPENEGFQESNKMHAMNGYMYGNQPDLVFCVDNRVAWHVFGMGSEVDIHTVYFHGQTVTLNDHRTDAISIYPAEFSTSEMVVANNPGRWMIQCQTTDHYNAGMMSFMDVRQCTANTSSFDDTSDKATRHYYIAAEEVIWNYGPSGLNLHDKTSLTDPNKASSTFFKQSDSLIGGLYKKALYYEYTDSSFTSNKKRLDDSMGFLGPPILAEVGDVIKVHFKNKATRPYSINGHGVYIDKANEGHYYDDKTSEHNDDYVRPNEVHTYTWRVLPSNGPGARDGPCITSMYYSAVDPVRDVYSGLVGPLIICSRDALSKHTKRVFVMTSVTDENESWYIDDNIKLFTKHDVDKQDENFKESNLMHGINGFLYYNLPEPTLCSGQPITWHVFSVGNEVDIHTLTFAGNNLMLNDGRNTKESISVFPGSTATGVMVPDNIGRWKMYCHTNDHYSAGMLAMYKVTKCSSKDRRLLAVHKKIRTYYIGAMETKWNYAPSGVDIVTGLNLTNPESHGYLFYRQSATLLGHIYKKAVYREFTDASFTQTKARSSKQEHLGIMGPMIRAEVGDVIRVVFKNMATRPYSVHTHGLKYDKQDDGATGVNPGQTKTYNWYVSERDGPGPDDPACIPYVYHSAVDPVKDSNSGLVGHVAVCKDGTLSSNGERNDGFKEFSLLFTVFDENESWYLDDNIAHNALVPSAVDKTDPDFHESNLYHAINGHIHETNSHLLMSQGDQVMWYVLGLGTEVDIHTVHFHGQTFIHKSGGAHRGDVIEVFPAISSVIEMHVDDPGTWLLHCHVNDHINAGMETTFTVMKRSGPGPGVGKRNV